MANDPKDELPLPATPQKNTVIIFLHPVFLALILFIAGFAGALLLGKYHSEQNTINFRLPVYQSRKIDLTAPKFPTAKPTEATTLLRKAWENTGNERYQILQQLKNKFPQSPEYKSASEEYARLNIRANEQAKKDLEQKEKNRLQEQQKAESTALSRYNYAKKQKNIKRRNNIMRHIIKNFPRTEGAKLAAAELEKTAPKNSAQAPQKKPAAKPPSKERNRQIIAARNQFFRSYQQRLNSWNLKIAGIMATEMATGSEFPELHYAGKGCLEDIKVLRAFAGTLKQYFTSQKGKNLKLKLLDGSVIRGKIVNISETRLTVLIARRFKQNISYPDGLNPEYVLDLYKNNRDKKSPPHALVSALYFYAMGNEYAAMTFFQYAKKLDPRDGLHRQMLQATFTGKK